jgi:hypothetical protein
VKTQLGELPDPTGKIALFLDQATWRDNEDFQ